MRSSLRSSRVLLLILVPLMMVVGCSSSSTSGTMTSYSASFNKAKPGFGQPDVAQVKKVYDKDAALKTGAGMLANWELAAAHQTQGHWDKSKDHFLVADAIARDQESKAVVSAGDAAKTAGSILTNDNALEFKGETFEKVLSHSLNAVNFIAIGDLQGARVEIRKADEYQKLALAAHEKALAKAAAKDDAAASKEEKERAEAARKSEEAVRGQKEISGEFVKMNTFTANVKYSFQDPFTYFLSGIVYELNGEKDDALIDFKKALELAPNSLPVRTSVLRLQGDGKSSEAAGEPSPTDGEVVVLYEVGFIPEKQQVKFPLPMPGGSVGFTAFPVYTDYTPSPERLELGINGSALRTEPVVDLHVLAVKALQDRWFGIASRELVRIVAKELAQKAAEVAAEKAGGSYGKLFAQIGGAVYKGLTQNADLRAFYGLPQQVQAARIVLPAGEYKVPLRRVGLTGPPVEESLNVSVRPGKKTIVTVRSLPNSLKAFSFGAGA